MKTIGSRLGTFDPRRVRPAPKTADPVYLTPQHRAWRANVLFLAGGRCEAIEDGERCRRAEPEHRIYADHIVEISDGGDPLGEGQALCARHHTLKTAQARAKRFGL